jgi:ABC-type dipeptide/oligopeptide/nickel transport system ATPase component
MQLIPSHPGGVSRTNIFEGDDLLLKSEQEKGHPGGKIAMIFQDP